MHYEMLEDLYDKFGGKFRFSVLLQKRVRMLVDGARPLVMLDEKDRRDYIRIAILEARAGMIWLEDPQPGAEPAVGISAPTPVGK
jgi:DNA-directed RNA polymerase subunit K/omega